MKPRILIVGFQRSGTTLLRRLLCYHPQVAYVIHEGRLLNTAKDRNDVYKQATRIAKKNGIEEDLRKSAWGDKVPFCTPKWKMMVDYCRKWQSMFGNKARIIVIVRHPYDVALSSERTFSQGATNILRVFASSMAKFISTVLADDRIMVLKFEDLVTDTDGVLGRICRYCGLDDEENLMKTIASAGRGELRYFDKVESSRMFAYKDGAVPVCRCNMGRTFNELNKVDGPLYELEYSFDDSIICPSDPTATPKRIKQYRDYYRTKFEIAREINPSKIVEIGVRAGYSGWAFLMACPTAKYYGFDAENGTHGGRGGPWNWWAKKIFSERGFDFKINAPFNTQEVDELPLSADFYHVDGDHTDEGVYHDLEICYRSAPIGAFILVDDYDYKEAHQVREGTDRWLSDHDSDIEWEHIKSLRGEILIRKFQ